MKSSSRAPAPVQAGAQRDRASEPRLHVAEFCAEPFLAGAARRLATLLPGLRAAGVETLVVGSPSSRLLVGAAELEVSWHELKLRGELDPGALLALRRLLAEGDFDAVHVHGRRGAGLASVAARLARVPLVRTFDGGEGADFVARKCVSRAIASTPEAEAALVASGFPAEHVAFLPAPVDSSLLDAGAHRELARAAERAEPDDVVVLALSSLEPDRGHSVLLRAIARLAESGIRPQLWICGDGPSIAELDRERRALELTRQAGFLGRRTDVGSLLDACDVYVDPGLTVRPAVGVLEAMSRGKAVVATRIGGAAHSVVDGETGVLVAPDDPVALAEGLRSLVVDAALRARLGAAGRKRAAAGFLLEQVAARHAELYAEVAQGARRVERSGPRP